MKFKKKAIIGAIASITTICCLCLCVVGFNKSADVKDELINSEVQSQSIESVDNAENNQVAVKSAAPVFDFGAISNQETHSAEAAKEAQPAVPEKENQNKIENPADEDLALAAAYEDKVVNKRMFIANDIKNENDVSWKITTKDNDKILHIDSAGVYENEFDSSNLESFQKDGWYSQRLTIDEVVVDHEVSIVNGTSWFGCISSKSEKGVVLLMNIKKFTGLQNIKFKQNGADASFMFAGCDNPDGVVETDSLPGGLENVTNAYAMFSYNTFSNEFLNTAAKGLTNEAVSDFGYTFATSKNLTSMEISSLKMTDSLVADGAAYMFYNCNKLTNLYTNTELDWSAALTGKATGMFNKCYKLFGSDGTIYEDYIVGSSISGPEYFAKIDQKTNDNLGLFTYNSSTSEPILVSLQTDGNCDFYLGPSRNSEKVVKPYTAQEGETVTISDSTSSQEGEDMYTITFGSGIRCYAIGSFDYFVSGIEGVPQELKINKSEVFLAKSTEKADTVITWNLQSLSANYSDEAQTLEFASATSSSGAIITYDLILDDLPADTFSLAGNAPYTTNKLICKPRLAADEYTIKLQAISPTTAKFKANSTELCEITVTINKSQTPYQIDTSAVVEHGSITTDPATSANGGDIVTVICTPDEGYVLRKVIIKDEAGEECNCDLSEINHNQVTFTMPDHKVFIEATTISISGMDGYAIFIDGDKTEKLYWEELKNGVKHDKYGYAPSSITDFYLGGAFKQNRHLKELNIKSTVTTLKEYGVHISKNLETLTFTAPENLVIIGYDMFADCSKLNNVFVGDKLFDSRKDVMTALENTGAIIHPDAFRKTGLKDDYLILSNSDLSRIGLKGNDESFNIPGLIDKGNTRIGAIGKDFNLSDYRNLKKLTMDDDSIGYIFKGFNNDNYNIEEIEFADCLKYIEGSCLNYCKNLRFVKLPKGIKEIGYNTLNNCKSLTSIKYGDRTYTKGEKQELFDALKANGVKFTEGEGFLYETGMEKGDYEFDIIPETGSCSINNYLGNDEDVIVPDTLKKEEEPESYTVAEVGDESFQSRYNVKSVVLPETITSIGWSAFSDCSALTTINIPPSVTRIDFQAFANCSNLNSVTFNGTTYTTGQKNELFSALDKQGVSYDSSFLDNTGLDSEFIYTTDGDTATIIGCNRNVETLEIPETVTDSSNNTYTVVGLKNGYNGYITDHSLSGFSKLKTLKLPDTINSFGDNVFNFCSQLETIIYKGASYTDTYELYRNIPDVSIGINTFDNSRIICSYFVLNNANYYKIGFDDSVENFVIPSTFKMEGDEHTYHIMKIANETFTGKKNLKSIKIGDDISYIGDKCFKECTSLNKVEIGSGVKYLGKQSFMSDLSLVSVSYNSVTYSKGDGASCVAALKENGVTTFGPEDGSSWNRPYIFVESTMDDEFYYNVISEQDKTIKITNYNYDENEIEIPSTYKGYQVVELADRAIKDKVVSKVTIPTTIKKLGDQALANNENLKTVVYNDKSYDNLYDLYEALTAAGVEFKKVGYSSAFYQSGLIDNYFILNTNNLSKLGYTSESTRLTLPKIFNKDGVTYHLVGIGDVFNYSWEHSILNQVVYDDVTYSDRYSLINKLNSENFPEGVNQDAFISTELIQNIVKLDYETLKNDLGYDDENTDLTIPNTYKKEGFDMHIVEIKSYLLNNKEKLKTITMGDEIKKIGWEAFANNPNLESFTFKNVTYGAGKDQECLAALKDAGIDTQDDIFIGTKLEPDFQFVEKEDGTLKISKSIKTKSKEITVPETVDGKIISELGDESFYRHELVTINLPKTIKRIGRECFLAAVYIETINYNGTKDEWRSIEFGMNWSGIRLFQTLTVHCTDGDIVYDPS
ncbi:MAG: leucine-rich repeat protein [Coriobacteriia bacterium]|nr:leucine-rich repeat protein [Coriobacteriia bacterium]